jgi:Predicted acyl-CoA transferases/carnitine dehydratase
VAHDPDLGPENPLFTALAQPGLGRFPVPGHAAEFSARARETPRAAPILGADTEEVLSEVTGLDDTEIARLFDQGIVSRPYALGDAA